MWSQDITFLSCLMWRSYQRIKVTIIYILYLLLIATNIHLFVYFPEFNLIFQSVILRILGANSLIEYYYSFVNKYRFTVLVTISSLVTIID